MLSRGGGIGGHNMSYCGDYEGRMAGQFCGAFDDKAFDTGVLEGGAGPGLGPVLGQGGLVFSEKGKKEFGLGPLL